MSVDGSPYAVVNYAPKCYILQKGAKRLTLIITDHTPPGAKLNNKRV